MNLFINSQEIKVSIIVPVYNCVNTLARALDSIIGQTYKNIQIILVDDGSTDGSQHICDEYLLKDNRIEVIHQKNLGVSRARNQGMEHINGEYVTFIDADDTISIQYIEILLYVALSTKTKICTCEANYCFGSICDISHIKKISPRIIEVKNYNFMENWSHATVWGVLFYKDLIKNEKFDKSIYVGEDSLFFVKALVKCKRISYISEGLYNYHIYAESLSHGKYNEKRFTEFIAWEKINKLTSNISEKMNYSTRARICRHALERYKEVLMQEEVDSKVFLYFRMIIKNQKKYYLKFQHRIKDYIEIELISKFYKIFDRVYILIKSRE